LRKLAAATTDREHREIGFETHVRRGRGGAAAGSGRVETKGERFLGNGEVGLKFSGPSAGEHKRNELCGERHSLGRETRDRRRIRGARQDGSGTAHPWAVSAWARSCRPFAVNRRRGEAVQPGR
jgi:hypothetical protein